MAKTLIETEPMAFTITIEGQEIPIQSALVPIDEIQLDPNNPRIKRGLNPPITQDSIRKFLLEQPGVSDLQKQIRDNQGLMERILVNQEYLVVEGNCRAAIYRRLRDAPQSHPRWQNIPTLVLPPGITDEQIAVVRAVFHVQPNKIRWGAYEQQEHLYDMATQLKMDIPRIARLLGVAEKKVERLIEAYEAMTTYYVPSTGSSDGRRVWSYFNELYKNPGLKDFRARGKNLKLFSQLVKDKKIPRGADVRQLPNIVSDSKAFQKLQATGFKPALKQAGRTRPSEVYALFRQIRKTRVALEKIKQAELEDIQGQPGQQEELRQLHRALMNVATLAKIGLK